MKCEVTSAVDFLANILRTAKLRAVSPMQLETFKHTLTMLMCSHYEDHWFPQKPFKGSGYRCLRINHKMDPLVARAGSVIGLNEAQLFGLLPSELTVWVDPEEVSYRIGEEGSIGVLYELDRSSTGSSSGSESDSSRTPSPAPVQSPMRMSPMSYDHSSSPNSFYHHSCKEQLRYFLGSQADRHQASSPDQFEYFSSFAAS